MSKRRPPPSVRESPARDDAGGALTGGGAGDFRITETYGAPEAPEGPDCRLYGGDNLGVLETLRGELTGKVDFVYLDPPFCTGNRYSMQTLVADSGDRQDIRLTEAYVDQWEGGVAGYLRWLEPRLRRMHELLAPAGNFVVHLDWRAASHVRLLLDEIFGADALVNEIVWYKGFRGTQARKLFQHAHDILWWYAKGDDHFWHQTFEPYKDRQLNRYNKVDAGGRRYALIKRRRGDGTIYYGKTYPGDGGKWRNDVIADIPTMAATAPERTGYATQKPLRLLELLVEALCPPGGLAADFFCGTGTTLRAAAGLGRRFLGADSGRVALSLTRRGLLGLAPPAAFTVLRRESDAPREGPPPSWLARDPSGAVTLEADHVEGTPIDFWAIEPAPTGPVFKPAWFSCGGGKAGIATASPPYPAAREVAVLVSMRDGREFLSRV